MGYIKHHAIIITSWDDKILLKIKKKFPVSSEIIKSHVNGYCSLFIPPDGSKEGWPDSDAGDEVRRKIKKYINSLAYKDKSNRVQYVEVSYDEKRDVKIESHN